MQLWLVLSCLDKHSSRRAFDRVLFWANFLTQEEVLVAGYRHVEDLGFNFGLCAKFTIMELDTVIFILNDEN